MTATLTAPARPRKRSFDPSAKPFRIHAFGAGVQSMALFEMWALESKYFVDNQLHEAHEWRGFFPRGIPDLCVFADTMAESRGVYDAVAYARGWCEEIGVPFEVVSAGDLGNPGVTKNGTQSVFTPLFSVATEGHWEERVEPTNPFDRLRLDELLALDEDGRLTALLRAELEAIPVESNRTWIGPGTQGQLRRQCTSRFKIEPTMKRAVELAGDRPIEVWLGISVDEAERMKTDPSDRIRYFYPLVFDQERSAEEDFARVGGLTRSDCITLLRDYDVRAGKSACVFCPYRSDAAWANMKKYDPNAFEAACQYDERARDWRPGYKLYVHRKRVPLREVNFELHGPQMDLGLFVGFDMSLTGGCDEGYCGL